MKISTIKVLRGPNRWSVKRTNLIHMELDLEIYEDLPTNKIDGFTERLTKLIPTLYSHRCSVGKEGGFIKRMKEGTWCGHVIEHVALEIQCLAGMRCGYGRTRRTRRIGVYNIVFTYLNEYAGIYAALASVKLVKALASGKDYNVEPDIQELSRIYKQEKLEPFQKLISPDLDKEEMLKAVG